MKNQKQWFYMVLMLAGVFLNTVIFAEETGESQGLVCADNDYALCSHANCGCLNPDGTPGPCTEYVSGTDTGWAQCTCPVVQTGNTGDDVAYNANFANLSCSERQTPSSAGTSFPTFVEQQVADTYSTYSFGDSLPGNNYGTLDSADLIICDAPKLMTLCLNMPCTINEDGDAVCYCQNVAIGKCPANGWNTLGGECQQGNCDPGENKIWSAACITATLDGIAWNTSYIRRKLDGDFTDIPAYCPD